MTPLDLHWVAYYEDGKILSGTQMPYIELKRSGLREFSLKNQDKTIASIKPSRGECVFYRCRTFVPLGNPTATQAVWYILGARSRKHLRLQIVTPGGSVLVDNQFRRQWYEPQWFKSELSFWEQLGQRIHQFHAACIDSLAELKCILQRPKGLNDGTH